MKYTADLELNTYYSLDIPTNTLLYKYIKKKIDSK